MCWCGDTRYIHDGGSIILYGLGSTSNAYSKYCTAHAQMELIGKETVAVLQFYLFK